MAALVRYLPFILELIVLVAALVDLIRIDPARVRAFPKPLWGLIIVIVPIVGGIVWFAAGREPLEARGHGRYRDAPAAPDDDPEFLSRLAREKEQEQRIRDLEQRLSELDDDGDAPKR